MAWKRYGTLRTLEGSVVEIYTCTKCGEITLIEEGAILPDCPRCGDNYDLETA